MKFCLRCKRAYMADGGWKCSACNSSPTIVDDFVSFAPELAQVNDGMPGEESFDALFELESRHFWFCARNKLIIWAIKKFVPDMKNFMEIGCGTGFVIAGVKQAFPHVKIVASEIYLRGLAFAKIRNPEADLIQMDARQIPFEDEFDLIGAFDVLEHIDDDQQVLSELRRAVRKQNGYLILTVPQHQFLWSYSDEYAHHVRRYSVHDLRQKVEKAGFEVLYTTSFVSILLPLMMLSRALNANQANTYDPAREFETSSALNTALTAIMAIERAIIRAGVRAPAGGSLLLLGKAI